MKKGTVIKEHTLSMLVGQNLFIQIYYIHICISHIIFFFYKYLANFDDKVTYSRRLLNFL